MTDILDPTTAIPVALGDPLLEPRAPRGGLKDGEPQSFRLDNRLARNIDILLQEAKDGLPFRTRSDFHRAASLFYWLWLSETLKLGSERLSQRAFEERLALDAADNAEWEDRRHRALQDIHNHLVTLINQQAWEEIYRALGDYYRMIRKIQKPHARASYIEQVSGLPAVRLSLAILNSLGLGTPPEYLGGTNGGPGKHSGAATDTAHGRDGDVRGIPDSDGRRPDHFVPDTSQPGDEGAKRSGQNGQAIVGEGTAAADIGTTHLWGSADDLAAAVQSGRHATPVSNTAS